MNILLEWFSSSGLMPHGFCYQWKPALVWLHAISDTLIALAYFLIPAALLYFVRKRRGIPFGWMFVCFGIFIAACGATHAMEVWTLWVPSYWLSGGVKVLTALASVPTAVFLVRLMPTALAIPSTEEMRAVNEELKQRASALKESESRLRQMAENIQEIFWMLNPVTKEATYVSPAFEPICELPLDSIRAHPTSYRELIHPQDRQRVLAGLEKLESTNRFDEEFRIVCPSGRVKWIRAIGFTAKDEGGKVATLVGTAQEITVRKEMEAVLRESEDRYRDLVENSTDLICTYNLQGRLLSVNELPAKLLGYSQEQLLKKPMRDLLLPEARAQFDESLQTIQRDGFVRGLMVVLTKTGERRIWEYHNTLRTEGVATPIVRGIAHDITEQRRMERALRLSEEKFSKAFRCSPTVVSISTLQEGRFLEVNEAFERHSGYGRDEIIGQTALELQLWLDPQQRETLIEAVRRQGNVRDQEISFKTKSGQNVVFLLSVELIDLDRKQCLLTVGQDISERKRAEEDLRRLSGQLLRSQDEERRRIARDLHDSTGQDLVALTARLSQLHTSLPSSGRKLRKLASQSQALADRCIREVRTLSYLLHPPMLDEAGLEDAICQYADGFAERTGIEVELAIAPRLGRMKPDVEMALFRVVQESLTNIQRHSGSIQARIQLDRSADEVELEIRDKGRGASAREAKGNDGLQFKVGVGIPSMYERVKLIGGRLEIESGSSGTTIRVTVPADE